MDLVRTPHDWGHAVAVLHVGIDSLGYQIGNDGCVAKLCGKMDARAAFPVAQCWVSTVLHQQGNTADVPLPTTNFDRLKPI